MSINAYQLEEELEKALEGLKYWEKQEIQVKFSNIAELDYGAILFDKSKKILLINIHQEN